MITGRPIQADDVELLEIFAQQASATIENSFLYDALGRAINVNSRIHEGAAFTLRLPIHRHNADE